MSVSKYDAYLRIGKALKNGDQKTASNCAQIIIRSNRHAKKMNSLCDDRLILTRSDKSFFK